MSKPLRLSHSQISTYSTCGKKYEYHYIQKLREKVTSAALLFGTALDNTINQVLLDKQAGVTPTPNTYKDLFDKLWLLGEINKQKIALNNTPLVVYAESDFDADLLNETHASTCGFASKEKMLNFVKMIRFKKKEQGYHNLSESERIKFGQINWHCLRTKGQLMLDEYITNVLPKIKQVLEVQHTITLNDTDGNSVTGIVDAVLDFGDGPVVTDLKTSSRPYSNDSASKSPQLSIYKHALSEKYPDAMVAFAVLYKKMDKITANKCVACGFETESNRAKTCTNEIESKRCGGKWDNVTHIKARSQVIIDRIKPELENNVVDNYETILKGIKAGIFYRNWDSCENSYGLCPYLNLCRQNKSGNLIKVE